MSESKKANENKANSEQADLSEAAKREGEILRFWQENKIFEQTLEKTKGGSEYVFYDGPPFATGTPHYGHITAGTIKDAIPRFETMRGRYVRRRWGWDCHGLPVENLIEKKLKLQSKKEIEEYGIANFNREAKAAVQEYVDDWKQIVPRLGRFVDMDDDYRTMDWYYTESVLQIFKRLYDQSLIYKGYKAMQICPRCETTLSNFEVSQGYKDITDLAVTAKFKLKPQSAKLKTEAQKFITENTFVLAWTTTPWTLPGNVALAVGTDIDYVVVEKKPEAESESQKLKAGEFYVLAKKRAAEILPAEEFEIVQELKGNELVGLSYEPLFDYYANDEKLVNRENGWKIYAADFVTTEDGTGIVHIASAFGEDDLNLGLKEKLPFVQHVTMDGRFKPEVTAFAGKLVKPKSAPDLEDGEPSAAAHQAADLEVLKYLAGQGTLFAKEKYTHSYPHCWRCETPLLNYATSSWFVKVTGIKDRLVKNNEEIGWVPDHIKEGRFGKWLAGARDWAISRSRFWGAPIPVWTCDKCSEVKVLGSVGELEQNTSDHHNRFFLMRHGEAENNISDLVDSEPGKTYHLTDKGREQVREAAEKLKGEKIDLVVSSDFARAEETAELIAEILSLPTGAVKTDSRLGEYRVGEMNGRKWADFADQDRYYPGTFGQGFKGGESCRDLKRRMGEVLVELNEKNKEKNILIVGHGMPLFFMQAANDGLNERELELVKQWGGHFKNGEIKEIAYRAIPRNEDYELDLHRPYIDGVKFSCACGGELKREPDVFDCWFESGSMPYGQAHWPFEAGRGFRPEENRGFPADFIAEGIDQTRGWFYSMLVLSTALFNAPSYKNVIVNGLVLTENGQKMSKSLKNYPDPMDLVNKYGADALRFYLLSSPLMRGEDLNFSEKGVGEVYRKIVMRLSNVLSFFEMYGDSAKLKTQNAKQGTESKNILDIWITARLAETVGEVTRSMERYELDRAMRPIDSFIDDLSNWYLRRSRDRFKSDDPADRSFAIATTKMILVETAKLIAPFMPFLAEEIYQRLNGGELSVHLETWPEAKKVDSTLIEAMGRARALVEMGLALRDRAGIKVRQPLAKFVFAGELDSSLRQIVADELNVKEAAAGSLENLGASFAVFTAEDGQAKAALATEINAELKQEGEMRELVRSIQELRKKEGLRPGDIIDLKVAGSEETRLLLENFREEIKKATNSREISFERGDYHLEIANKQSS